MKKSTKRALPASIRHKKSWIEAGTDPLEAQRMRSKLVDQTKYTAKGTSLTQASERYVTNLEARGLHAKSTEPTALASTHPFRLARRRASKM